MQSYLHFLFEESWLTPVVARGRIEGQLEGSEGEKKHHS